MPRPRFARLAPEQQRRILERAGQEFAAHGYKHASLNHVISELGLNKGVFYYYFDGKADLFGAVVHLAWEKMLPTANFAVEELDASSFWPRLELLLEETQRRVREEPWLGAVLRQLVEPPPAVGVATDVAALLASGHTWMEGLMRHGQKIGAVRRDLPFDLLLSIITAADQAADRWLFQRWEALPVGEVERLSRCVFDMWRRVADTGFAPPGEGS